MKRTLLLTFVSLFLALSLIGCGDKKVESDEHFGYNFEYVQENFDVPEGFELLSSKNSSTLSYSNPATNEKISFMINRNDSYIDYLIIYSTDKENIKQYFESINTLLDITDSNKEINDIKSLIDSDAQLGSISLSDETRVSYNWDANASDDCFFSIQKLPEELR